MKPLLTVAVITGNSESTIFDCLKSAGFADEIVVVAANSTDGTVGIIKKYFPRAKILTTSDGYNRHFSKWRNLAFKVAASQWLFYVDSDEMVTPELKNELLKLITQKPSESYYVVPRYNFFLGHRVRYGGTYPDYVKRLFKMDKFHGFTGVLHEEPQVDGNFGYLSSPLLHYTHVSLQNMMAKSIVWTEMEAEALFKAGHPPVVWWRFIRMMLTKFLNRLILQSMWRDGIVGWISVIFETFDTYMIYARLYELQLRHA